MKTLFPSSFAGATIGVLLLAACSKSNGRYPDKPNEQPDPVTFNYAQAADSAQVSLYKDFFSSENYFNQNNEGHTGFNYWWNAHALDVLVDGYLRTGNTIYKPRMDSLLKGMYRKNGNKWLNNFYDDMEWLALASLRAYQATQDIKFKDLTEELWGYIKVGWTEVHGGGIMWEKNSPTSKNACSNGPALILAVRLYKLNGNAADLDWARRIYNWQRTVLVESARGIVWDGVGNYNEAMVLTYNQGTWIGGALELYSVTNAPQQLHDAVRLANYVVNDRGKFSPGGILKGENTGDGGLFKGIFIRYLTQLIIHGSLDPVVKNAYLQYLKNNGHTLVHKGTFYPGYYFHPNLTAKPANGKLDCSVELSGIMLLESIDLLKREGLLSY